MADTIQLQHRHTTIRRGVGHWNGRRGGRRGTSDHHHVVYRVAEIHDAVGNLGLIVVVRDVHQCHLVPIGQARQHAQQ